VLKLEIEVGVFTLSTLPFASIKDSRWLLLARVSTNDQLDNTSTKRQLKDLHDEKERADGKVIKEIERAESGADMNRKSLNEVLELARNDEFDILGVWKLDRLTRSDPWDCINYLRELKKNDVVVYSDDYGYFDWDERQDFEVLIRQVLFSREWYTRIKENAEEGQLEHLKEGKYPFGEPHFGYKKESDDSLYLSKTGEKIIPVLFEKYLDEENRAEARRQVNSRFGLEDDDALTDSQVRTVLESPLCIGQLTLKGQVVATQSELQCVSKETYNEVQTLCSNRRMSPDGGEVLPDPVNRATERFGPEFLGDLFDTLHAKCPECDGTVEESGSTTVRDRVLREYDCEECDFTGPLFSTEQINKLDSTIPLACPFCVSVDDVTGEKSSSCKLEYIYTCNLCENMFAVDVPPNTYQRAFEVPEAAYRWDPNQDITSEKEGNQEIDPTETMFMWGKTSVAEKEGTESEDNDDDDEPASPMPKTD
jgi:DNA invertase Pin-like site-specific DNA recombinase